MAHASGFMALAQDAKTRIHEITLAALEKKCATSEPLALIDVREESEWAQGSIPGAVHLSKGLLECDIEGVIRDRNTPIVLFCGGGFRSALAADSLQKMGYTQVYSLNGGYRGWTQRK